MLTETSCSLKEWQTKGHVPKLALEHFKHLNSICVTGALCHLIWMPPATYFCLKAFIHPPLSPAFISVSKNIGSSFNNSSYTGAMCWLWGSTVVFMEEGVQYSWLHSDYLPAECLGPWLLQVLSASNSRLESQFSLLQPSLASCLYWAERPGFMPAGPHSLAWQVFLALGPQVSTFLSVKRKAPWDEEQILIQ